MSLTLPADYVRQGQTANSVEYALPTHTVEKPRVLTLVRTVGAYDARRKLWSLPRTTFSFGLGRLDSEGFPVPNKVGLTLGATGAVGDITAEATLAVDEMKKFFTQPTADIVAALFTNQVFPEPA